MDGTNAYKFIRFGPMGVTNAYIIYKLLYHSCHQSLQSDMAIDVTKPYKFICFGAMGATKPYKFIRFGAMDATKPYKFVRFGAVDVTKPYKL